MPPPRGLPGSSGDPRPLSILPGKGPFPVPSLSLVPPGATSWAVNRRSRKPPGQGMGAGAWGKELPSVPTVAGTPASATAATALLTSIAEHSARSSQGRSHVYAERKHSRGSLRPGLGSCCCGAFSRGPDGSEPLSVPTNPREPLSPAWSRARPQGAPTHSRLGLGAGPSKDTPLSGSPPRPSTAPRVSKGPLLR